MYTKDSALIGYKGLNIAPLVKLITGLKGSTYSVKSVEEILGHYDSKCAIVNLNTDLVVAQMLHETAWLRSWWSQRPRRNPAGLRVTGEKKKDLASYDDFREWQYNPENKLYERGLAFRTWEIASATHMGHLLCYIYTDRELNPTQFTFSLLSPNRAILDQRGYRGVAKKLSGLNKRWAIGPYYADGIAKVAIAIRKVQNV